MRPLKKGTLLLASSLAGLCALGEAGARTVRIVQAQTLELRRLDDQELVIITGNADQGPVELRVDDDVVRANRVEYNRTRRTLTLIGAATYRAEKDNQDLRGENLVVDLAGEGLTGEDVLISDADIEIRGGEVERIPGQLRATNGYFTPCAKCGRTPNDYAFRAERLIVYPGDRLVAYRAQLLLADVPVLYLPVIVLPLNEPERQPRLAVGSDATDGRTIEADLPFSIGANTLGTTLIRYYQNRSPVLGVGVALRSYNPLPYVDRVNLYTLANPRPFRADGTPQSGYDVDLDFTVKGRVPLELAVRDLDYTLSVQRSDITRSEADPDRGVTSVNFSANVEYPRFSAALNYVDRFGPEPEEGLGTPLKRPEVVLDPKPYTRGNLGADFRVTAGQYTGRTNPAVRRLAAEGPNVTTTRLEETHSLTYSTQPWKNADLTLTNNFTGRYYGTGARTVDLTLNGTLTQRFNVTNAVTLRAGYLRYEGTSPFYFDRLNGRRLSAPLSVELSTVPVKDVTFRVNYTRDLFPRNEQRPASFQLTVNRTPVNLSSSLNYDFLKKELESADFSLTLGDSSVRSFVPPVPAPTKAGTGQPQPPAPFRATWPAPNLTLTAQGGYTRTGGYQPFTVKATVTGDNRANNFNVYVTRDVNRQQFSAVGGSFSAVTRTDTVLNPVTVTGQENLNLASPRITGSYSVTWRGLYTASTSHDLSLNQGDTDKSSGTLNFSVGTAEGRATSWKLTYGGPYDLRRRGFTQPSVTGTFSATRPGQSLSLAAVVNTPGLDQTRTELSRGDLTANWQFGTRVALNARAQYRRDRPGTFPDDTATDTLVLDPLRVGIAIGQGPRPGAYLTGTLRQTFTWKGGERVDPKPLAPVIGLTIDRCCWALQAEIDLTPGVERYRLGVSLPGSTRYPLFDYGVDGVNVPLLPDSLNPGVRR